MTEREEAIEQLRRVLRETRTSKVVVKYYSQNFFGKTPDECTPDELFDVAAGIAVDNPVAEEPASIANDETPDLTPAQWDHVFGQTNAA